MEQAFSAATKSYQLEEVACIKPPPASQGISQIISSIEPDAQSTLFAAGGVTKKINLYSLTDYRPLNEMETTAKISSLGWNPHSNRKLYCSDYSGALSLFDTSSGALQTSWTEHEKRIWTLDVCPTDGYRVMTGSDDCYVKVWSESSKRSVLNINIRANVCSVRFHPTNANIIAASAADHRVFLFDLRKSSRPLASGKDHKKSVSYVRFDEQGNLVSAATDCSLRFWETDGAQLRPVRSYTGHLNEKNFVGLSVKNGLYVVGSEDNSIYIYQKYLNTPILQYTLPNTCPLTGDQLPNEPSCFVGSVSWVKNDSRLLVANSLGSIHVLSINHN